MTDMSDQTDSRPPRPPRPAALRPAAPPQPSAPPRPAAPSRSLFPWAPPPDRGQPAREALTRDQIVDAAIRVLDAEGLEALSMRRLGQELGAGATSLYWHIRSKDELLDLVLDRVIGEVVAEVRIRPDDWRWTAADAARTFRRVLVRHRHVTPIMGTRPTVGPNALRGMDSLIGVLVGAGFAARDAVLAANTIINWAGGYAVFESRHPLGPDATAEQEEAYSRDFNGFLGSLPRDEYRWMIELAPLVAECTADVQFEYGLARLLDGIALQQTGRATPS
jgi:AcrR family transcriptional regulator